MSGPRLAEAFLRLQGDLRAIGASWALVGGLAVSARAEPRTTRVLPICPAVHSRRAPLDELARETARFQRVGRRVDERMRKGIEHLVQRGRARLEGDSVILGE